MSLLDRRGFLGSLVVGGAAIKGLAARAWSRASGGTGGAAPPPAVFRIQAPGILVELSQEGEITGLGLGEKKVRWAVAGGTSLTGCRREGPVEAQKLENGGVRFTKRLAGDIGGASRRVTLFESFFPTKNSVRWEIRLETQGSPWSTPIETRLQFAGAMEKRFWTTWGDTHPDAAWKMNPIFRQWFNKAWNLVATSKDPGWNDPFTFLSFPDRTFWYGSPYYRYDNPRRGVMPIYGQAFCIPLATVIDAPRGAGMSLALSPEDILQDMTLETTTAGGVKFSRLFRRLSGQSPADFSMDLVAHEPGWRGGLRWMTERYPEYFDPPMKSAEELAGTGAYSSYEGELDAAKLKRMGFTVNWKASFDFPYQGMFIPPVPEGQAWTRESPFMDVPPMFIGTDASVKQLAGYSRRMRAQGFYVLNYFNAAEFGKNILYPAPPFRRSPSAPDFWKDPNDYLYAHLSDALVFHSEKEPPFQQAEVGNAVNPGPVHDGWRDVILDWGEPCWQNHLLEQTKKLIEKIPDSSGLCIDRLDYLRLYNFRRDDGLTWYDGPARSLIVSWKDFVEKQAAILHAAGQVLFVNNHVKRLDILRPVDGLFDEHTAFGSSKNLTALLGMFKPTIGWVREEDKLKPDPDTFMQRFLYLGIFPMAPYPQNDHSLLPGKKEEQLYMDYGLLLKALRGRKWVLLPEAIRVERGRAKANLFKVPEGYVAPVVLAGSAAGATVTIRSIPEIAAGKKLRCEVLHPGESEWKPCALRQGKAALTIEAPLLRGCAMLRLS